MITIDVLVAQMPGLDRHDLERWISNDWVRADPKDGTLIFGEIDVFRVRLIRELRDDMDINEAALPIVLSLLDQVYDLRRRMRELSGAIGEIKALGQIGAKRLVWIALQTYAALGARLFNLALF